MDDSFEHTFAKHLHIKLSFFKHKYSCVKSIFIHYTLFLEAAIRPVYIKIAAQLMYFIELY
jgi:hypothetical protein